MRVVVSVLGRFHAFDLARELHGADRLERLLCARPRRHAERCGVPAERVETLPLHGALDRVAQLVAARCWGAVDPRALPCVAFDRAVARRLRPGADVFVGWSGSSLAALGRARELGMLAVLERGSSHVLHQRDVLAAEHDRLGVRGPLPHPDVVARELDEYVRADRIAVPTAFARRTFVEHGVPAERLLTIPYGVDLRRFTPPDDRPRALSILHVGAVSVRKGVPHLLEAFRRLGRSDVELTLVGPVSSEMRPLLRGRGLEGVSVVGPVPQSALPGYHRRASLFSLASLEEGLAMVIPQAMACGLPVVATEESGAGELVREGIEGCLVAARDPDALAERLAVLLADHDLRASMGRAAALRVGTGFSWADYGERAAAAYEWALARERGEVAAEACA